VKSPNFPAKTSCPDQVWSEYFHMKITNVQETKTHLSRLLEEVQAGKEVVIGKAGKPIAKLVPIEHDASERI